MKPVAVDPNLPQLLGVVAADLLHDGDETAQGSFDLGHGEFDGASGLMGEPEQVVLRFSSHALGVLEEHRGRPGGEQDVRHHQHLLPKTLGSSGDLSEAVDVVADEPAGPRVTHVMKQSIDDLFDREPQKMEVQDAQAARGDGRAPVHPK